MPKRRITLKIGEYYHIYNRAVSNTLLFREHRNYPFFLDKVKLYLVNCVDILAYCLMPTHFHFLLEIKTDGLSQAMALLSMSYAKAYNKVYHRSGSLFQGRYKIRHIQDLNYLNQVVQYIHLNPVKDRLVNNPSFWEYSSLQDYFGIRKLDFINPSAILEQYRTRKDSPLSEMMNNYREHMERYLKLPES